MRGTEAAAGQKQLKLGAVFMKKVLVLEDEANIRSFVVINLRRSGYEPIEAENGAEALEKLKVNPDICLALLDVMLPDIDGFEVCRRIRASNSKIGIIMPFYWLMISIAAWKGFLQLFTNPHHWEKTKHFATK